MSVTGFSVQHDPEVQAYRKIRAAYLEEKAAKKREEKLQLRQIKEVRRAYLQNGKRSEPSMFSKIARSLWRGRSQDNSLLTEKEVEFEEKWMDSDSSDSEMMSLSDALK